jgi:hypothetical protein
MTQPIYRENTIRNYTAVPAAPVELFPDLLQAAFNRLEEISKGAKSGEVSPSRDNVEWAKKVLLRILPRHYLIGAEIDAFQREIHVNWERGNKRVVAFMPAPNQLKLYCERVKEDGEVEHHLSQAADEPWAISGVLKWLFHD